MKKNYKIHQEVQAEVYRNEALSVVHTRYMGSIFQPRRDEKYGKLNKQTVGKIKKFLKEDGHISIQPSSLGNKKRVRKRKE